jgi:hypothetical protein
MVVLFVIVMFLAVIAIDQRPNHKNCRWFSTGKRCGRE